MTSKAATKATDEKPPRKLSTAAPEAAAEAREQAEAYESLFGNTDLELDDGTILSIPPHPDYGMLDDDQMEEYDEYLFEIDTEYEREPDIYIPEQRLKNEDGVETGVVLPADTQQGRVKTPYRRKDADGKSVLVKPPRSVKMVQIALGKEKYDQLREGGKGAADVWRIWTEQGIKIGERRQRDSKSDGGERRGNRE